MSATKTDLEFIDADGHILEHPSEFQEYAPKGWRDRVWHIETDAGGDEYAVDPLWRAASETGLAIGLHPFLAADLPGACVGLRLHHLRTSAMPPLDGGGDFGIDNIYFTQAIANPVDMMSSMAFLLAGGVCERFPDLKLAFLEANGGWLVSWLERLDHHYEIFSWDVPALKHEPSEYFRRQCWISFDADESTLAFTAKNPRCGADRIIWASDYPHPDAKYPGVTAELAEAIESLTQEEQRRIAGENAAALYGLS